MTRRLLVLRKETLTELTAAQLRGVAGGTEPPTADVLTCTYATLTFCPDFYCSGTC